MLTIPYENLDILAGKPVSLAAEDIYEKIVTNRRGGYCFELNALLHHMLAEMGFSVRSCFARFLRGESEPPFRRHRVVVVMLEGAEYLLDIGVGQIAPRFPLKLAEGEVQEQNGEMYRFVRDAELGWILEDLHKGEWRRFYSFTEEEQLNIDYIMPSFWCEHAAESPFTSAEMFSIKTDTGRITLDSNIFHIFDGETVTERYLTEEEVQEVYSRYFGLPYDAEAAKTIKRYTEGERK